VLSDLEAVGAVTGEAAGTARLSAMDPGALSALMLAATADSTTLEPASLPDMPVVALKVVDLSPAEQALDAALGLAMEALASTQSPAPARAAAPGPSAASVALAPFAVDLPSPPDTVCEVATRLRIEEEGGDGEPPALRTVVRTRSRPVIERQSGEVRILDRTRRTPEPTLERPRVEPVPVESPIDGDDTQRIHIPAARATAVVLRGEVLREEAPSRTAAHASVPPASAGAVARTLRSTQSYVAILLATGAFALAVGVALGLAIPR
jgi:hypothetical protein